MITKKVAILGKLPTKFNAPFDDPEWDIWTLNYQNEPLKRVTLWFDIHTSSPNPRANITRENYPFKEAFELAGGHYFNNTVSYMIAYAILQGYEEIALYGMRFNDDTENRTFQKQNVRELVFLARGKGIKVTAPIDKSLLEGYPVYGVN